MRVYYIDSKGDINCVDTNSSIPILKVAYIESELQPYYDCKVEPLYKGSIDVYELPINKIRFGEASVYIASMTPMEATHILKRVLSGTNLMLFKSLGIPTELAFEWYEWLKTNSIKGMINFRKVK